MLGQIIKIQKYPEAEMIVYKIIQQDKCAHCTLRWWVDCDSFGDNQKIQVCLFILSQQCVSAMKKVKKALGFADKDIGF